MLQYMSRKGPEVGKGTLDFVEDILLVLNPIKSPFKANCTQAQEKMQIFLQIVQKDQN